MKVIAFNGSARKDGNTATLINLVFDELQGEGIETELFQFAGKNIKGCKACFKCFENKDKQCIQKKDVLNECLDKMLEAEGIIFGSPTYFGNVSTDHHREQKDIGVASLRVHWERKTHSMRVPGDLAKTLRQRCGDHGPVAGAMLMQQMIQTGASRQGGHLRRFHSWSGRRPGRLQHQSALAYRW